MNEDARRLAGLIRASGGRGTVVFTGAGMSTESGIPDFRGPSGLWTQNAPISYQEFMADPVMRRETWRRGLNTYPPIAAALPNGGHRAIARWWEVGLVAGVVTQNIDGLHQKAGLPDSVVLELHGHAHRVRCLGCGALEDRSTVHGRVQAGDLDPACLRCGGMLKPGTIAFGEAMPRTAVEAAERLHRNARLCLVIGSSLVVYPAADLPELTYENGGALAIVNATETHLDWKADYLSRIPAALLLESVDAVLRDA